MILLNGQEIKPTIFPDKTSQVWKIPIYKFMNQDVEWIFEDESEFMHLAQLKDLIDSMGYKTTLTLNYLPYARQDKEISNNTTFALQTFIKLLNHLKFDAISCLDPHSKMATVYIDNFIYWYPICSTMNTYHETKSTLICYPDEGAKTKYSEIYEAPFIYGEKTRDQESGYISDYKIIGNAKDNNVLIIDDICDGGATFVLLAKALKEQGAKEVNMFVSHGLFTKGTKILKDSGINRIFTAIEGEIK
jgi:ribose-phosphate pyrophosphokinase